MPSMQLVCRGCELGAELGAELWAELWACGRHLPRALSFVKRANPERFARERRKGLGAGNCAVK